MVDAPEVGTFVTALGVMGVVWRPAAIVALAWGDRPEAAIEERLAERWGAARAPLSGLGAEVAERIRRAVLGEAIELGDLPLELGGCSSYRKEIYARARQIPRGTTLSYGALAEAAGHPGTAQAVGTAMAKNPCPIIIPCHRVVARHGPGGFSAPGGLDTKARLLAIEGGQLRPDDPQLGLFFSMSNAGRSAG